MSTRSLTVIKDEDGVEIATMYVHSDGYPTGHGKDLKEFLEPIRVGNGLSLSGKQGAYANGANCLAAQIVAHFKTQEGGTYLCAAGVRNMDEEYIYEIESSQPCEPGHIRLRVVDVCNASVLFCGTVKDFDPAQAEGEEG